MNYHAFIKIQQNRCYNNKGDIMTFYENLRIIREDRGYTQKQIAEVLETTRQYYSDYENGKRDIPIRVYITLSKFYGVSIDYLAGQEELKITKSNGSEEKADVG